MRAVTCLSAVGATPGFSPHGSQKVRVSLGVLSSAVIRSMQFKPMRTHFCYARVNPFGNPVSQRCSLHDFRRWSRSLNRRNTRRNVPRKTRGNNGCTAFVVALINNVLQHTQAPLTAFLPSQVIQH